MEDMKINSKNEYKRDRVNSGKEPHKMLEMLQEQALGKAANKIHS
jgi:hypothetical protein